jgi:hypothetical protein
MKLTKPCDRCGVSFTRYYTPPNVPKCCSRVCAVARRVENPSPVTRAKLRKASRAESNGNWRGGLRVNRKQGRAFVRVPEGERHIHPTVYKDGYMLRYHYVWNRANPSNPVQKGEVIHHVNHDSLDDRIENLEKTTQSEHISEHIREWAVDAEWRAKLSRSQRARRARERTERES